MLLLTPRAGAGGAYIEALRGGLRELGYVEGQNLLLEIRSAEGRPDRLPRLAAEILGTRPDVLVTAGSEAILTLKRATDVVPIVSGSKGECGFLCKRWLTQGSTVDRVILTTEFGLDPLLRC